MKHALCIVAVIAASLVLVLVIAANATGNVSAKSRDGQTPSIDFIRGDFGGPYWADGWLTVRPGQEFRIYWRADSGSVRWCSKWSLDPKFRGFTRGRGEFWTRLYKPNPNASHGGWVFGLTCGNGVYPNAVVRIWVKVVTT